MLILHLALTVVVPIAVLVAIGWGMDRAFKLDVTTLVRLNFWIFVPALALVKLIQAPIEAGMGLVVGFGIAQTFLLVAAGWVASFIPSLRFRWRLLILGSFSYNIGNYGIPLVSFAFGERWLGVVIVLLTVQSVALFTFGPILLGSKSSWSKTLIGLCKVPVVIAVVVALLVRFTGMAIPAPIMSAMGSLADGLVPVALLTLGVQMARTPLMGGGLTTATILALRLLVAPASSWILAGLMGFSLETRTVLTVCSALPLAVNVFILCSEYDRDVEEAARAVLWSTVIATLLLPLLIALLPGVAP